MTTVEAFALVVRTSQNYNIKIHDLAARVVAEEDEARHMPSPADGIRAFDLAAP